MTIELEKIPETTPVVQFEYENEEVRGFYAEKEQQADEITFDYRWHMGRLILEIIDVRGRDEAFAWAQYYLKKSQATVYRYLQVAKGENPYPQLAADRREYVENGSVLNIENSTIDKSFSRDERGMGNGSGEDWHTPAWLLELVREVISDIDCDPASCAEANQVVRAQVYYSKEDDGLQQEWQGQVFLNPPYKDVGLFLEKLLQEYQLGHVTEAIAVLLDNSAASWYRHMYTNWHARFYDRVQYVRHGEIKPTNGNPFGTVAVYLGSHPERFREVFSQYGAVYAPVFQSESSANVVDAGQKRIQTEEEVREYNPFEEEEGDEPEQSEPEPESRDWSMPAHVVKMWQESTSEGRAIAMKAMVGQFDGTKPEPQHRGGGGGHHVNKNAGLSKMFHPFRHAHNDGSARVMFDDYSGTYSSHITWEGETEGAYDEAIAAFTDAKRCWLEFNQMTSQVGSTVKQRKTGE